MPLDVSRFYVLYLFLTRIIITLLPIFSIFPSLLASFIGPHPITLFPHTFQSPSRSFIASLLTYIGAISRFPMHSHICDSPYWLYTCTPYVRTSFIPLHFLTYVLCYLPPYHLRLVLVFSCNLPSFHPVTSTVFYRRTFKLTCVHVSDFFYNTYFTSLYCSTGFIAFMSMSLLLYFVYLSHFYHFFYAKVVR